MYFFFKILELKLIEEYFLIIQIFLIGKSSNHEKLFVFFFYHQSKLQEE